MPAIQYLIPGGGPLDDLENAREYVAPGGGPVNERTAAAGGNHELIDGGLVDGGLVNGGLVG